MWRAPVVKTPPSTEPVTLSDAKAHLRVDHTDDDALIGGMISAARAHVESITGQRIADQVLILRASEWGDLTYLPTAPIVSVEAVKYIDQSGDEQSVTPEAYQPRLEGLDPQIVPLKAWPLKLAGSLVTVEVRAGYAVVPPDMLAAIKLLIGDLYEYRETGQVGSVSSRINTTATAEALLCNHRIHLV